MNILATLDDVALAASPAAPASSRTVEGAAPAGQTVNDGGMLMRVLDELDYGVMLVTGTARLRFVNRVALRYCTAQGCMRLANGHLQGVAESEHNALLKACGAAMGGRRSMVTFRAKERSVAVAVLPMTDSGTEPAAPAVLLVLERRQVCEQLSVEFFAREHRITMAETAVLKGLCDGFAPIDIARHSGVALSTVRSQIGSMRMKTGARTIGSLVRMVTVLPPIVAVLN